MNFNFLRYFSWGEDEPLRFSAEVLESFEIITIVCGVTALIMAVSLSLWFMRSPHGLAKAVAYDKAAEAVSMSVFVTFAVTYYFDLFVKMPIAAAVALRLIAMCSTMFSSAHLGYQAWQVIRQESKKEKRQRE